MSRLQTVNCARQAAFFSTKNNNKNKTTTHTTACAGTRHFHFQNFSFESFRSKHWLFWPTIMCGILFSFQCSIRCTCDISALKESLLGTIVRRGPDKQSEYNLNVETFGSADFLATLLWLVLYSFS